MKNNIYGNGISPKCIYCETGKTVNGGKDVLCRRSGVMQPNSCCKKFIYDPLKRTPTIQRIGTDFLPDDFEL